MYRYIIITILSFSVLRSFGQEYGLASSSSPAPANASTSYKKVWSGNHNPAILSNVSHHQLNISYYNRFFTKELSTKSLSFCVKHPWLDTGVSLCYFGASFYHETQIGLAFSRQFSPLLSIGIQGDIYSIFVSKTVGSKNTFVPQIGFLSNLNSKLSIGVHIYNPTFSTIQAEELQKKLPSIFSIGSSYQANNDLLLIAQIDKEIHSPLIIRGGVEYFIKNPFYINIGCALMPITPSFGMGLLLDHYRLDCRFDYNINLGINSSIHLCYLF